MLPARILLVLTLVTPLVAQAANADFNRLVKQAERQYRAGQYKQSAESLIEAYAWKPHPRLIYNIARAYDQAGELDLALEFYQRYVGSSEGTDPTLLKRSALAIDRVRGLVAQRKEAKQKQAEEKARIEAEAAAATERAKKEQAAKQQAEAQLRAREKAQVETRARARSRSKIAALALGGVAVAGLGTGTWFGLQASAAKGRFNSAQTVADKQLAEGQTKSNALIADAGFAAGVAAAILAVVLYPKGDDAPAPQALLVPHPGGAGLEVSF